MRRLLLILVAPIACIAVCFGDILYCTLPNTNTLVTVSHKYFIRPNRALEHAEYIEPDVMIDLDNPERDMAWEWIVENYGKK
ncbi:MAG: hypothetical protein II322_04805 [Alistipes sp.]|nr:hypothetical protein [Alistipes sp.]